MTEILYNKDFLRLSLELSSLGEPAYFTHKIQKTSRICGSRLSYWLTVTEDTVSDFSQDVKACAVGQASAALIARHLRGMTAKEFLPLKLALETLLRTGEAHFPDAYQDFKMLAPVHLYKSRHGAALLPIDCLAEIFQK